ncbi:MAG: hypothetical protein EKK40_13215 [Bradyrhizobiaceae bacterium]|nr:MAG: hypothetical protein EKK40_13215 [Bradyrhizobiaceae bacterium]
MCILCNDENAYAGYMAYLDDMELRGKTADPGDAMTAAMKAADAAEAAKRASKSPFICDPIEND